MTLLDNMAKAVEAVVIANAHSEAAPEPAHEDVKATLVANLEQAAITLRDAELAKNAAVRGYEQALLAFNRFVAPAPGGHDGR